MKAIHLQLRAQKGEPLLLHPTTSAESVTWEALSPEQNRHVQKRPYLRLLQVIRLRIARQRFRIPLGVIPQLLTLLRKTFDHQRWTCCGVHRTTDLSNSEQRVH